LGFVRGLAINYALYSEPLDKDVEAHLLSFGCKFYTLSKFITRIQEKFKNDPNLIIEDLASSVKTAEYYDQILQKLKGKFDKDEISLSILIGAIKDAAGQVIGHTKDRIPNEFSSKQKEYFISGFFTHLINKGYIKGEGIDLLSKDINDKDFINLSQISIDKNLLAEVTSSMFE